MKVLVYPHTMEIGGSQLNAVETGAALRGHGHDVTVISRPGPLVETVQQGGLTHIPLDSRSYRRPSPRAMAQPTRLVREQRFDVVHGYEWPPEVEAALGPGLRLGAPVRSSASAWRTSRPSTARLTGDALRTGAGLIRNKVQRRYQRWRGTAPTEDFNAVSTILQQEVRGESHSAR